MLMGFMIFFVMIIVGMLLFLAIGLNFIVPSVKKRHAVFLLTWLGLALITYQTVTVLSTTSIITDPSVPFLYTYKELDSR